MRRFARAAPYAALAAFTLWLYAVAGRIEYVGPPDRIGPDFWPKAILGLLGLLCAYEIAKHLVFGGPPSVSGVLQTLMEEAVEASAATDDADDAPRAEPSSWRRLAAGVAAMLGYVLAVEPLGFFVATSAFLAGFMRIGGYQRWGVALSVALAGSFAMVVIFMKVVYVSLPLGAGPFRALSIALLAMLGVR